MALAANMGATFAGALSGAVRVLMYFAALTLVYVAARVLYNIYWHPLAKFPGPKIWAASRLRSYFAFVQGDLPHDIRRLHERYGEVVRIASDEVSFIAPAAWQDIYGHGQYGKFIKDKKEVQRAEGASADDLFNAHDIATHLRMRRLLSHAFSERALKEQQALIVGYVDLLIEKLRLQGGQPVNIVHWYNYTTFDLIGDLSFGESFGCLESSKYHPWVKMIFDSIKQFAIFRVILRLLPKQIVMPLIPQSALQLARDHMALTEAKVLTRLATPTDRPDFIQFMQRHNDNGKGMSEDELIANASLLVIAGSETTATALSGTTYWLLKNRDCLKRLVSEIRDKFRHEEMSINALAGCEYLNCVLREGMRLYPAVPAGMPRRAAVDGATVGGYSIPKDAVVSVPQLAAYTLPQNFSAPLTFDPLRWQRQDGKDNLDAFEPFTVGPRNCIGQSLAWIEMRLILARVLFHFDLELIDDNWNPDDQKIWILWAKPSLNVRLREAGEAKEAGA